VELAQLRLLEEFYGFTPAQARLALGYSLGEGVALIAGGVYELNDLLPVLVRVAQESAPLAEGVTLGVLFSRGPVLDFDVVSRLCQEISQEGKGVIGISTYLSPNSLLVMGQGTAFTRFEAVVHE